MSALAQSENRVHPPQSLKQVKEMLRLIDLSSPPDDVLMEISKQSGQKFKDAIANCINKDDNWQVDYAYLNNLLFAVSQAAKKTLEQLAFGTVEIKRLILIGNHEGDRFRKHLVNARQNGRPASDMDYLRRIMAVYGGQSLNAPTHNETSEPRQSEQRQSEQQRQAVRNDPPQRPEPPADNYAQHRGGRSADNVTRFPERNSNPGQSEMDLPEKGDDFQSRHIYGGKNAICFNADEKRNGGDKTVRIEAAIALKERQYDWKDKISIQLSHQEMMGVFSVLMGWIPIYEGKGHGPQNEKSFSIKTQDQGAYKFYISVNCKDKQSRSVPVMAFDGARLATFILGQMMKNEPDNIKPEMYVQMVKHFAVLTQQKAG